MIVNLNNLIRYSGVLAIAAVVAVSFQNCGQAGQISQAQVVAPVANLPNSDGTIPDVEGTYRDFSKSVRVNGAQDTLDVLVVVDNSVSMEFEQSNMATRFSSFLDQLQGLNWRVGVTTTHVLDTRDDMGIQNVNGVADGQLLPMGAANSNRFFISSSDNLMEAQQLFSSTVQRSESGSAREQGIRATYRFLERSLIAGSANSSFLRSNAALSVIVVTDANESPYSNVSLRNNPANLLSYISTQFPSKAFSFHSIIVRNDDINCLRFPNSGNESYGMQYQSLSLGTGGIVGSVCEADYGAQLRQIGRSSAELVRNVSLDCLPADSDKDGRLDIVIVNNQNPEVGLSGYSVEGNQVRFASLLNPGDYTIRYRCLVPNLQTQ